MSTNLEKLFAWKNVLDYRLLEKRKKLQAMHDDIQLLEFQVAQISKEMTAVQIATRSQQNA